MRNPVARHDHNRAATHPDRSKQPQLTVVEGLLDHYAIEAQGVACGVYQEACSRTPWGDENYVIGLHPDDDYVLPMTPTEIRLPELSEEDKKDRVLRVELVYTPDPHLLLTRFLTVR